MTEKIVPRGAHWGARLRSLRTAIGIDQQDLAAGAGIRQMTLSAIERGDTKPHARTVVALAGALGVRAESLRDFCAHSIPLDPIRNAPTSGRRLQFRMLDDSLSPWIREGDTLEVDGTPRTGAQVMPELAVILVDQAGEGVTIAGLAMPVGGRVRFRRGTDAEPVLVVARSILPVVGWTRRPAP